MAVVLGCLGLGVVARAQIVEVGNGGPGPVKADHLTAELVALSPQVAVGGTQQLGLVMSMEEHWHVYWVNAGDSGQPPSILWKLPAGLSAGPLQFPPPVRLPLGTLMDFGYEDQVAFPVTLTAAPSAKPGRQHLDAEVRWLVCSSVCLPGKAHLGIDVEVVKGPVGEAPLVGALGSAIKTLPKPLPPGMSVSAVGDAKQILVTLKTGSHETDAELYPFDEEQIANAADQPVEPLDDGITIRLQRASESSLPDGSAYFSLPKTLHALVKLSSTEAYDLTATVTPGVVPAAGRGSKGRTEAAQTTEVTVFTALLLALLGGIVLNLMPCVFPVLFLKGLALVHGSAEEKGRQRAHGLMYTLGIVVSFWVLVGVLLALRAGGQQLGWGFQLQSPGFVAVLASLVFFLGLSLAGQFEFGLGLTSAGNELTRKQGLTGSFFTGVLATVVATPCTAPLMGASVGFALAQPAWETFLIFTALAVGLALPYLVLTIQPQWTRLLPKPGAWMEVLKQLTAIPLFATAIWLSWVFGQLSTGKGADAGIDRIAWLLSGFLVLGIAGWALGRWPAQWKGSVAAAALMVVAIYLPLHRPKAETMTWTPYTQASFAAARATGDPVFIDFTAAWCLSCKYNEGAVLQSAEVENKLAAAHFQLLKADWTQYDPVITQQLAAVGRSGVPTYVIYPPGKVSNPDVLPELLTKEIVLKQIEKDRKPMGE